MASNVMLWRQALALGFQPSYYSYLQDDLQVGEYIATLDYKIWALMVMAINCYFTLINENKKIQLTVYCTESGLYKLRDGNVDFTSCSVNATYRVLINANQKKKKVFTACYLYRDAAL